LQRRGLCSPAARAYGRLRRGAGGDLQGRRPRGVPRSGGLPAAMTHNGSAQIVQKLWNYCNVLRDDGLSYGDYVEQLTYLLFLKMAHERTQPPWNQHSIVP